MATTASVTDGSDGADGSAGNGGTAGSARTVTLTDLVRVVLRRWPTLLAGALVGICAGLAYLAMVPPSYTATTEVVLRLPVTNPFTYPGTGADRILNMNVESSLATSGDVLAELSRATGRPAAAVRSALLVEAPVGGQQLRFRYTAATADQAVLGANTAATAYLELREEMYAGQRDDRVTDYNRSIAEVTDELATVQQRLADLPSSAGAQSPAAAAALTELSGLRSELAQLRDARTQVQAVDLTPGWVTRPATGPPPSSHDQGRLFLLAGAAGGVLLGAVVAFARESGSRRVRTPEDAVAGTGLPLIGMVRRRRLRVPAAVAEADRRYASVALAAWLREPPLLGERDAPRHRLVLISPRSDLAGAALVAGVLAGLAVELAAGGRDVYVAGDLRRVSELRVAVLADRQRLAPTSLPVVARGPEPIREPVTLNGQAAGRVALLDARPVAGVEPLGGAIPVGAGTVRIGPDPDHAGSAVVLVDAPPAELSADGVLAAQAGLAVVVVACDQTRLVELRRLVERLRGAGARPVGVLVTRS